VAGVARSTATTEPTLLELSDPSTKFKNCFHHNYIVTSTLADDGIQWVLIPPRAPHWGGKRESAVPFVKLHLRRVNAHLRTLLAPCEPLCYTLDTENNYLSPAHFLIGRPLATVLDPDLSHIPVGRLGYWKPSRLFFNDSGRNGIRSI